MPNRNNYSAIEDEQTSINNLPQIQTANEHRQLSTATTILDNAAKFLDVVTDLPNKFFDGYMTFNAYWLWLMFFHGWFKRDEEQRLTAPSLVAIGFALTFAVTNVIAFLIQSIVKGKIVDPVQDDFKKLNELEQQLSQDIKLFSDFLSFIQKLNKEDDANSLAYLKAVKWPSIEERCNAALVMPEKKEVNTIGFRLAERFVELANYWSGTQFALVLCSLPMYQLLNINSTLFPLSDDGNRYKPYAEYTILSYALIVLLKNLGKNLSSASNDVKDMRQKSNRLPGLFNQTQGKFNQRSQLITEINTNLTTLKQKHGIQLFDNKPVEQQSGREATESTVLNSAAYQS